MLEIAVAIAISIITAVIQTT